MPPAPSPTLRVYVLSVGQADTSVLVTPEGSVVVIDAVRPPKLVDLLGKLGAQPGDPIAMLVITHPHDDHYRGANRLLNDYHVEAVALAPFWCSKGLGSPTYRKLVNRIDADQIPVHFVSGYNRFYPDGALVPQGATDANWDEGKPYLELIGPSNSILDQLERSGDLDTNHLSVVARCTWKKFRMVIAGDAQMENWAHYDRERMLEESCKVLKTAHHGSANGTQWERIERLDARCLIVSSDPDGQHRLPDLVGCSIFARLEARNQNPHETARRIVALTRHTGSILIDATDTGSFTTSRFGEAPDDTIDLGQSTPLTWDNNPTDWRQVLQQRIQELYPGI